MMLSSQEFDVQWFSQTCHTLLLKQQFGVFRHVNREKMSGIPMATLEAD